MNLKALYKIVLLSIFFVSCAKSSKINGFFLLEKWSTEHGSIEVWDNSGQLYKIDLSDDTIWKYDNFAFYHTKDAILCKKYPRIKTEVKDTSSYEYELISIDYNSNFLETVFTFPRKHYVGDFLISKTDRTLIYVYSYYYYKEEQKLYNEGVCIVDLDSKKIIDTLDDANGIVYMYPSKTIGSVDDCKFIIQKNNNLYIYNIKTKKYVLLEKNITNAKWSGNGKYVSYILNDEVYIYDIKTGQKKKFYTPKLFEYSVSATWVNDGEYILVSCLWFPIKGENWWASIRKKLYRTEDKKRLNTNLLNTLQGMGIPMIIKTYIW